MTGETQGTQASIDPETIEKNPSNPRRYFNEERLDQLRTSLQEVGVLVPLIVYKPDPNVEHYVLMDGERRWRCALDLGMDQVPVNVIPKPSPLDNLLRMFNIHNVREDWPLISVTLSLRDVMLISGESRETRLAEMTGLTRSTVRRARRLLTLPDSELQLIQEEAHLDRTKQVHREDLYLEIQAAESVLRKELPELDDEYDRPTVIRQFAKKAESGNLPAVTDFRYVSKLVNAIDNDVVDRQSVLDASRKLVEDESVSPRSVFESVAADAYRQQALQKKADMLVLDLEGLVEGLRVSGGLRDRLRRLRSVIDRILDGES
ncbi:MAG: ParB/RepB/Spo0J family partition protein [Nocardioidaceae bacterium]|nr:ParB/RepB/Spo0J family partition protein [Nocardioidaceae bacterium]